MNKELVCPWCGCKGHKRPFKQLVDTNVAREFGWYDVRCQSCDAVFKSYKR